MVSSRLRTMVSSRLRTALWALSLLISVHTLRSIFATKPFASALTPLPCSDLLGGCEVLPLAVPSSHDAQPVASARPPSFDPRAQRWRPSTSPVLTLTRDDWPVPSSLDPSTKYLSYLAHSGFHNQRLALINALTVAWMTNRTLLVPPITLGASVAWVPPPLLQEHIEQAERSNITECRKTSRQNRKAKCGLFWKSRRASWSWLLGPSIADRQPVIDRPSHSRAWFKEALGIEDNEIMSLPDPARRSYRILDTDEPDDMSNTRYKYDAQILVEDLEDMSEFKLIEFGSLFGGTRLRLKKEENLDFFRETQQLMAYRDPMLDAMSEAVAERLGGRHTYVGLHLRLGSHSDFVYSEDAFHTEAVERTDLVFQNLLSEQYGLGPASIADLLARNRRPAPADDVEASTLALPLTSSETHYPSPNLSCPSQLYPAEHPLAALNTPLYVATDGANPREDHLTALFRNTFPCLFFLSDFQSVNELNAEPLEELDFLERAVDPTGEQLRAFLEAFLEGEVAAKGRGVVGTPTSTFSAFLKAVLHQSYLPSHPPEIPPAVKFQQS